MNYIELKSICCFIMAFTLGHLNAQTPCVSGNAAGYPCDAIDLMSVVSLSDMGCSRANDIWGWTDPQTSREYAIFGCTDRTTFIDVTNPANPILLGSLATHSSSSSWRDMKTYANHTFIVSEASNHGMQVFDLTQLRNISNPPVNFSETAFLGNLGNGLTISNSHNIVINEGSGYAYTVGNGGGLCAGGLTAINISNPTNPVFAGCFEQDGYTHDAQCVNYIGPDSQYAGTEICFNSNENTLTIVDVTDKTDMTQISRTGYTGQRYTHQGWVTENHEYFLMNDELDESNNGHNTRTYIWDVRDLDNPIFMGYYEAADAAIDHNLYIKGNLAYMANYRSGLRVVDISDIANGNLSQVGHFDIYPSSNSANFNGAWSNYPYFDSGTIIVSGIEQGLFVLKLANTAPTCNDGILNGDEIGIDCGGPDCPSCPAEDCTLYDFESSVVSYDPNGQDFGTASVQDNGATVFMEGNVWKAVEINYTITPNTVIAFDFKSTAQGEIHEVAFDNDLAFAPENRIVVYGNQGYSGDFTNPTYSGSGNFERFVIQVGAGTTGTYQYLVLTGDDDANAAANSYFSNVQIYEDLNGDLTCNETSIDLDICVLEEAIYDPVSNTMSNTLETLGLLPTAQPFNQAPWNYLGTETRSISDVVDWVLVSFRTGMAVNTEIAKTAALLQADGCIYFPDENVLPSNLTSTSVYIVIETRNHLTVMTPQAVSVANNTLLYDFRLADSYKNATSTGQKQLSSGEWCMLSGDIDHDHDINGADKGIWANLNGNFEGYYTSDINQDGDVNGADKADWLRNNGLYSIVPK